MALQNVVHQDGYVPIDFKKIVKNINWEEKGKNNKNRHTS